jgi:hypothetical protein
VRAKMLVRADSAYADEVRAAWMPLTEAMAEPLHAAQGRGEIAAHVLSTEVVRTIIGLIPSETLFTGSNQVAK